MHKATRLHAALSTQARDEARLSALTAAALSVDDEAKHPSVSTDDATVVAHHRPVERLPSTSPAAAAGATAAAVGTAHGRCCVMLNLPAECVATILQFLPVQSIARVLCTCQCLRAIGGRSIASIAHINGADVSPPHDLSAAFGWLLRNGCRPKSALLAREATDEALSLLLSELTRTASPSQASLCSLELLNCNAITDAALSDVVTTLAAGSASPLPLESLSIVRCPDLSAIGTGAMIPRFIALNGGAALTALCLDGCNDLDDAALGASLGACPMLISLGLNGCRSLTTAAAKAICELHALTTLDVSSCPGVTALPGLADGCPKLERLNISLCKCFGNAAMSECVGMDERGAGGGMPALERLNVSGTAIGNEGAAAVAQRCPRLAWFNCTRCVELSDDGAMMLAVRCAGSLRSLFLAACPNVTDVTLCALGEFCSELSELHLAGCRAVTDVGLLSIAKGCPALTSLSVDTCSGISDESVVELARRCARLDSFQANGCAGLGDDSLVALAMGCRALTRIDVRACARVTQAGLEACAKNLPRCRVYANTPEMQLA